MGCSTEKEDQWDTASAILNVLLKNPVLGLSNL